MPWRHYHRKGYRFQQLCQDFSSDADRKNTAALDKRLAIG